MTRAATKCIADMVTRVLSGSDTVEDRTGHLMTSAYARCLVGAWADRTATSEKRLAELRALVQATVDAQYPGPDSPDYPGDDDIGERRRHLIAARVSALSGWLSDNPEVA